MKNRKIEIQIKTQAHYLADRSSVESSRFIWSYDVTIINQSNEIVQLLSRAWRITDMKGKVEEVKGPGVIGLQPLIKPGKEFAYSSFCQLSTPQGTMDGQYEMQTLEEDHFFVVIPKFVLTNPSGMQDFRSRLH